MAGIYDEKILGLQQQRDFARKLRDQENSQAQGQMVSGWYVPNTGNAVVGALRNVLGAYQERNAENKLSDTQRQKVTDTIKYMNQAGVEAPFGLAQQAETPAQSPSWMDRAGALFTGTPQPQGTPAQPYQQNVAQNVNPDTYEKALSGLISVNPEQAAPMATMYQAKANRESTKAEREYIHQRNAIEDQFKHEEFQQSLAQRKQQAQEANDMRLAISQLAASNSQAQAPAPTVIDIRDPNNPDQMIKVDARNPSHVFGVAGAEPKAMLRQQKEQDLEEKQNAAKDVFSTELDNLERDYNYLNAHAGITNPNNPWYKNAAAGASSALGPSLGALMGTYNQSARNSIEAARSRIIPSFKEATRMSSKQMDSNAELKAAKNTLTDPSADYVTNMKAIEALRRFGSNPQQKQNIPQNDGFSIRPLGQ